jgi:hypothetical protein
MSLSSPAAKAFFASSQYAVVGASADPSKFGNKVSLLRAAMRR